MTLAYATESLVQGLSRTPDLADWYRDALNVLPSPVYMTDADGRITYYNHAAADLWGREPSLFEEKWSGAHRLFWPDGAPLAHAECPMAMAILERRPIRGVEIVVERPDGTRVHLLSHPTPITGSDGRMAGAVNVLLDMTERRATETRLQQLAYTDALTGLPNRIAILGAFEEVLERARSNGRSFQVVWLDIDRFKEINDVFGHAVGDEVLRAVARAIGALRPGSFLARLGADEFMLLLDAEGDVDMPGFVDMLAHSLAEGVSANGHSIRASASIGIAAYPRDGMDAETLIRNANAALDRAKSEGRGTCRSFDLAIDRELRDRRALSHEMQGALRRGEFGLHFQPQAASSGALTGFEALIRWNHPHRGLVSPETFIPLAEENGQIVPIGAWVIETACKEAARWHRPVDVAVNISPIQFVYSDLESVVAKALSASGLDPDRLELEITEGILIEDFDRASTVLKRLKALGLRIALDDFGMGYSSLSYLHAFPFSKVKLDRTLIRDARRDSRSGMVVETFVELCHRLGMAVLAEGVETKAQASFLADVGCDEVQGYLIGRPAAIETYGAFTAGHRSGFDILRACHGHARPESGGPAVICAPATQGALHAEGFFR